MTMRTSTLPLLLCLVLPGTLAAQTKPALTPADLGQWESVGAATLAPNGHWLAYAVNRVDEENALRVRGLRRDTTVSVTYASAPVFTGDARWLAYTIGVSAADRERLQRDRKPVHNSAGLMNLTTLETTVVSDVASFRFSADGRFVALRRYPAEDKRAADLLVRELATGVLMNFGSITEYAWSDRGALLAVAIETEGASNAVQLYDAATGRLRVLESSPQRYRGLAWRERSDDLAVLRTRTDSVYRDTAHVVLAWTSLATADGDRHELDPATTPGVAADLRIAEHRTPEWTKDGALILIGMRARERALRADSAVAAGTGTDTTRLAPRDSARPAQDSARALRAAADRRSDVQVWHARDVRIMPMQKAQEQQDLQRTLLAAWHVADGRVVQVGTELLETARLLEGGRYATETDRRPYAFGTMFGRPYQDIWLIDVRSGQRTRVIEKVRQFYGGSATGRYLLWYDGRDYWSYDIAAAKRSNLTAGSGAELSNTDYDYPNDQLPPRGIAGWTRGDRAVLIYDKYDIWSFAPDGSGGRRLTDGASERIVHRYLPTRTSEEGIDTAKPLYLTLLAERTKQSGFARVGQGRAPERLILEDARVTRLIRADSVDVFAFTRERFDDSPDWFVSGAELRAARQVTRTNPFQENFAWGRAELVDFKSSSGRALQAILLYPANHDPSQQYPMIVYTYEQLSQGLHNYVVPSERSYYNFNVFTANGYFVLMPDIVYRDGDPGVSALEAVEPAVRTIVDRGLVDARRVGLVGHSWGGYQATYLPTRTPIFAAAVAGAPITNFLSFAGAIHWTPGIAEFDHWETGQARMGVPPWEDLEAYLRNSPIYKAHELKTPMLMMFGDADGTVDWHQGIEFYNFARRAGNEDFVLLVYPGEDHGLRKKENQIDYHRRILQWFGHYLKGEPAAPWIREGMTWLQRKSLLDTSR
jgi:dienelactone hydrolase